jgi:hypothetical protein
VHTLPHNKVVKAAFTDDALRSQIWRDLHRVVSMPLDGDVSP